MTSWFLILVILFYVAVRLIFFVCGVEKDRTS